MTSESRKRANRKWETENTESIRFRVPVGKRDEIKACADALHESVNEMLLRLCNEEIQRTKALQKTVDHQDPHKFI